MGILGRYSMHQSKKKILTNVVIFIASLFILVIILEGCIFISDLKYITSISNGLTQYDEKLGWSPIPNYEGVVWYPGEFKTKIKINSAGFNDKEYEINKSYNNITRAVVIGDSFTFAVHVEQNEIFTEILEREISNFETINMGVGGYGNDQELLMLETKGLRYNPDLVILMFYVGNDIVDNTNDNGKPMFAFDNDSLTLTNVPPNIMHGPLGNIGRFFYDHSYLYRYFSNKLYYCIKPPSLPYMDVYLTEYPPDFAYRWELTKEILKATAKVSDENDSDFMIVIIPSAEQIYEERWQNILSYFKQDLNNNYTLSKPNSILVKFCDENDIIVLDLLPEFEKHAENGEQLYLRDGHWNVAGNELAARLIYQKLYEENLLSAKLDVT